MGINNIRFAMLEIYDKYKQGKISQAVAEYFISRLDSVQREKNVQNLSQIIYDCEHADININFGNGGKSYIFEEEHSKLVRELFFMDQGDKYPIYLGDIIKLNKEVENDLEYFLEQGVYFPSVPRLQWGEPDLESDKRRFRLLPMEELKKYQKYINDLINSRSVMKYGKDCPYHIEQKRFEAEMFTEWQVYMLNRPMFYRIDAYNLIDRSGNENNKVSENEDEERE